jgi:ubiquinone/menaquinone biosynthesis C-methylase UbiE
MKNDNNTNGKTPDDTSWGNVADWYDDLLDKGGAGTYQREVILPNLLRILSLKGGETLADIACGQGFFSREITKSLNSIGKNVTIIASDISSELVRKASMVESANIKYHVAQSHELGFIQTASVDKAIIILALQNIERYTETITECSRILKSGGSMILVLNHPAFRIPKRSSWGWEGDAQYRRIDAYMSESKQKIDMNPGKKTSPVTYSFHRPLQGYFKACAKAGLLIARLEEWVSHKVSQPGPRSRAAEENRMRTEIPMFMCLEAKKI